MTKTHLRTGSSIGAGSIIRCGIDIGEFAMVGAGAVVTKSVPAFHLVMGLPARKIKMICACGQTQLPLGSQKSKLLRSCCKQNLDPQLLALAQKTLQRTE